jgi:hypothetical protein
MRSASRPTAWVSPAVLWLLIVVAPLPLLGKSTTIGVHLGVLLLMGGWLLLRDGIRGLAGGWLWGVSAVILIHTVATLLLSPCRDMAVRSIASATLLALVVLSLAVCARAAAREAADVGATLALIAGVVLTSVLIHKAWLMLSGASPLIRPSGLFDEPSHLALACAPLLAALVVSPKPWQRWWGWLMTAAMMALAASATLFVLFVVCLSAALVTNSRRGRVGRLAIQLLGAGTVVVSLILLSPFRQDFIDRVTGLGAVSAESNVSSLIYLNGLQTALANFEATHGIGLGANRMGCEPRPVTDVTNILEAFELGDYNYNDGSFTAAKLLSEFGLIGAAWLVLGGWVLIRAIKRGRMQPDGVMRQQYALAAAALLVVTFGAFVRGTGYFSGSFLMGVFFLFWVLQQPHGEKSAA